MKKFLFFSLIILLLFTAAGCTQIARSRVEIDQAIFVRVLSIDKGENNNIKVTITSKNVSAPSGDGAQDQSRMANSISSEGKTVFDAVRNLWSLADRRPYYGHTEFILISEEAAKEGILKYMDFISRDHQFRHNSRIYIVKGTSACSLIDNSASAEFFIADRLRNTEANLVGVSIASKVTVAEAMLIFDNPNVSTFIPFIEQLEKVSGLGSRQDEYDIAINGYAVFKKDKLVSFLDRNESRGINWIRNRIASGTIIVKGNKGEDISLEIINSRTRIKPKITDSKLLCTIFVDVGTNLDEITASDDIFNRKSIDSINRQQEKIIKREIEDIISLAQRTNLDFLGIIREFHMEYPVIFKDIEKNWSELFPDISFDVVVNAKLNRTYLLREPTGSKK